MCGGLSLDVLEFRPSKRERLSRSKIYRFAKVAELADAPDLGSGTERCGGSSPPFRTKEVVSNQFSVFCSWFFVLGLRS
jgi:hypothetical protein